MAKYFRIIVIREEEIESSGAIDCSVILVPLSSILGWYVTVGAEPEALIRHLALETNQVSASKVIYELI